MRITLALIALSVTPVGLFAAQQSDSDKNAAVDYHCDKDQIVKTVCEDMEKRDKDARQKFIADEAQRLRDSLHRVDEAKKDIRDVNNARSTDKATKIDGVTGVAQDLNEQANGGPIYGNTVSQDLTDKSISLLDRLGRQENVIMENAANAARSAARNQPSLSSSFSTQEHQFNESTRDEAGAQQTLLEQRLQQQEQIIASSPHVKAAVTNSESTSSVNSTQSLDRRLQDKEANIMSSASSVKAMAAADRRMEAEAQTRRAEEARQEAAHRAEMVEQTRARAEAERVAENERKEAAAAEEAREDREETREEAREARAQRAAFEAAFGPPLNQASPYTPYVPSYTLPVSSYGTYWPSYDPSSLLPNGSSSGSYLGQDTVSPISSPDSFNAFSCMSNLLTESQCLRDHVKPIELSPGCFDDPGTLALPSCIHGIYGGSSNPSSPAPVPATDPLSTPPPTPAAAPPTAPKTTQ